MAARYRSDPALVLEVVHRTLADGDRSERLTVPLQVALAFEVAAVPTEVAGLSYR